MKKFIAHILSWLLFWVGDIISRPMHWFDWYWIYPVYNKLMLTSSNIQNWAGNKTPWGKE